MATRSKKLQLVGFIIVAISAAAFFFCIASVMQREPGEPVTSAQGLTFGFSLLAGIFGVGLMGLGRAIDWWKRD